MYYNCIIINIITKHLIFAHALGTRVFDITAFSAVGLTSACRPSIVNDFWPTRRIILHRFIGGMRITVPSLLVRGTSVVLPIAIGRINTAAWLATVPAGAAGIAVAASNGEFVYGFPSASCTPVICVIIIGPEKNLWFWQTIISENFRGKIFTQFHLVTAQKSFTPTLGN